MCKWIIKYKKKTHGVVFKLVVRVVAEPKKYKVAVVTEAVVQSTALFCGSRYVSVAARTALVAWCYYHGVANFSNNVSK